MKLLPSLSIAIVLLLIASICVFIIVRLILIDVFTFITEVHHKQNLKRVQLEKEQERIRREEELKLAKQREEQKLRRLQYEQELAKQRKWESSLLGKSQSAVREISGSVMDGAADVAGKVGKVGFSLLVGIALQKVSHSKGKGGIRVHSYKKKNGTFVKSYNRRRPH